MSVLEIPARPADWLVQCAWCGAAKDRSGNPIDGVPPRAPDSHGICNVCAQKLMQEMRDGRRH